MQAVPTTVESAAGFVIATLLGIMLAIIITYSRLAHEARYPNLIFFQLIPKIALAPLFIIWLAIAHRVCRFHRILPDGIFDGGWVR